MNPIRYGDPNWLALKCNNEQIRKRLSRMTGTVIDLGCGTRVYEPDIRRTADRYFGIDWARTFHGLAADVASDLNRPLPFADAVADTVVCFQVLEHLREPARLLAEARRILRPGGRIFLSVPFQWWIHEAPYDYFRYTRYGLEHLFTTAGFREVEIEPVTGFWGMMALKWNGQTARLLRGPGPLRWLLRILLVPFWWAGQTLGPLLDRVWPAEEETAGYFVTARRP